MKDMVIKLYPGCEPISMAASDREILRALARQVQMLSEDPRHKKNIDRWTRHNDLQTHEPLVFIDPENGWNEIIPASALACQGEMARAWESGLRRVIFRAERLKDDCVIEPVFTVPHSYTDTGWGLATEREGGENGGAYHIKQVLTDYEEDFASVRYPQLLVDMDRSAAVLEAAKQVFDGILTVRQYSQWWWSLGLTWKYIDLRGMEDFMCDFLLEPEWIHRMMELLCQGALDTLDALERENLLYLNTGNQYVGSGGFGFTKALPQLGGLARPVAPMDMWGFVESQETVSISPDMYGEFIFPYHRRIAERFGLNCFGCCEPYEGRWSYAKQLPRLRRVSCSPWSDRARTAELLGSDYIASHKLNPSYIAQPVMNEEEARRDIRKALEASRECVPELIMKDTHTLGNNPQNAVRWVEIAREEIDRL